MNFRTFAARLSIVAMALAVASCSQSGSSVETSPRIQIEIPRLSPISSGDSADSGVESLAALNLDGKVDALLKKEPDTKPKMLVMLADIKKSSRNHAEAAVYYLAAIRRDPKLMIARYQFACNLALWGHRRLALETIRKAVDDGFWGYEMMRTDDDFASIQDSPEFKTLLTKVKDRYPAEAAKRAGKPHLRVPEGKSPVKGWPIIVFLHGYGDRGESYIPHAEYAAVNGFAGIAISGPVVQWEDQFAWPSDRFETTHGFLQQNMEQFRDRKDLDRKRVFLVGFSQGAVHAAGLLASHPEAYAGGIALSPGGDPGVPKAVKTGERACPLCVIHGKRELLGNILEANSCATAWKRANWPVLEETHPDRHQFPEDWDERFPRLLKWLMKNGK